MSDNNKKTTYHLTGINIIKCTCNSDNKPVDGTEQECVLLFNEKRISYDTIVNSFGEELSMLEQKGKILIIDKITAANLMDPKMPEPDGPEMNEEEPSWPEMFDKSNISPE